MSTNHNRPAPHYGATLGSALDTTSGTFVAPLPGPTIGPGVVGPDTGIAPGNNTVLLVGAAAALLVMGWVLTQR